MLNKVVLVGELVAIEDNAAVVAIPAAPNYPAITVNLNVDKAAIESIKSHVAIGSLATIEACLIPSDGGKFGLAIQNFYFSGKNKPEKAEESKMYS